MPVLHALLRLPAVPAHRRSTLSAGLMPLGRQVGATLLPLAWQRGESLSDAVNVVRLFVAHDLEHLAGDHRGEHVQHFMTVVAIDEQPLGGRPHLGRVVGPQPVRDDLVHGDVKYWVDDVPADADLASALLEGAAKFGVLGFDQQAPLVLVGRVQPCQVDAIHFTFGRHNSEALSLFVAHHTHPIPRRGNPPRANEDAIALGVCLVSNNGVFPDVAGLLLETVPAP